MVDSLDNQKLLREMILKTYFWCKKDWPKIEKKVFFETKNDVFEQKITKFNKTEFTWPKMISDSLKCGKNQSKRMSNFFWKWFFGWNNWQKRVFKQKITKMSIKRSSLDIKRGRGLLRKNIG